MCIEGMALNAGPFSHHADGRQRRSDAAVQIDRRFDDAPPGFRLLLGPALEGVGPCHVNFITLTCAMIIDKARKLDTHSCIVKLRGTTRIPLETAMETKIAEIADGIYRLSTFVPDIAAPAGFTFNQFLVLGDEPLMFHTGLRKMFELNREAVSRIIPPERLR